MVYHPKINRNRLPKCAYDSNTVIKQTPKKVHKNTSLLITVGEQAIAAGALIWAGYMIGGHDAADAAHEATKQTLILTGALNAPRSILWAAAHAGVKNAREVLTLKSKFKVACASCMSTLANTQFGSTTLGSTEQKMKAAQNLNERRAALEKHKEKIDHNYFMYENRNVAHTKVNIAGTALGAAFYLPMALHGAHDFIQALSDPNTPLNAEAWKTLINGEFIGGGGTTLAYLGWSKRFLDAHHHLVGQFKKYTKQESPEESAATDKYNPHVGVRFATYHERSKKYSEKPGFKNQWKSFKLKASDVLFEWTPLVLFMAKGGAFIAEGGAAMTTSGSFFAASGINEIKHEKGRIIKGKWHKAEYKLEHSKSALGQDAYVIMKSLDMHTDDFKKKIENIQNYIKSKTRQQTLAPAPT